MGDRLELPPTPNLKIKIRSCFVEALRQFASKREKLSMSTIQQSMQIGVSSLCGRVLHSVLQRPGQWIGKHWILSRNAM